MISLEFIDPLGAKVLVRLAVDSTDPIGEIEAAVLSTRKKFGSIGFTSGEVPYGGHRFPLEAEADFDWSILGAKQGSLKSNDGSLEQGVWYRGDFYKRRELEPVENKKMKLAAAIKYSRGARDSDPPERIEKSGEAGYITLAMFRGGKRKE